MTEPRKLAGWFPLYSLSPDEIDTHPDLTGALLFEPRSDYDSALIGYTKLVSGEAVFVYDWDGLTEALREDQGDEGACEWISFNMVGAYVGPQTPFVVCSWVAAEEDAEEDSGEELVQNLWDREIAR